MRVNWSELSLLHCFFGGMMDIQRIKDVLKEYAMNKGLELFDVAYHRNDLTLSVTFDQQLSMEELETVSGEISVLLDQYEDEFDDNYFLDVSTVGAERPIRNEQELEKAIGSYIFIRYKDGEYYGDLLDCADGKAKLEVRDKTRKKQIEIEYEEIKEVRYAVRF